MTFRVRHDCRICGHGLRDFLDLGRQPLANRLLRPGTTDDERFPLTMARCRDCGLVQLREVVDSALLFSDYAYVPSTSSTMRAHFDDFAEALTTQLGLSAGDVVVDIGSNDGLLLSRFQKRGMKVHGIEMAENLALRAAATGIPSTAAALSDDVADRIRATVGAARLVTATNVFAHVDDVRAFLRSAVRMLDTDGVFVVEVQSFADTAQALAFDMTYHEHLTYYSARPLIRLCELEGLALLDVERIATHGGSLRATIGRRGHALSRPGRIAARLALEESIVGEAGCAAFARGALRLRDELRTLVLQLRSAGHRVAGYGAPAKATVLLNFCGFGPGDIEFVVDRNPDKQGRLIPGARIPVVGPERLATQPPSHLLLLAWNIADEIMQEQVRFRETGGRFVRPVPIPTVID